MQANPSLRARGGASARKRRRPLGALVFAALFCSAAAWSQEPSVPPEKPAPDVPAMPAEEELPRESMINLPAGVEPNAWQYIVVHHSASPGGNAAAFDRLHRAKGWDGLAYHFVIDNGRGGGDGHLEVGARWWRQKHGAHAGGLFAAPADERNCCNEFGIGICLVGNLEQRPPTPAQMDTLAGLIHRLRVEFLIPEENILGHRHVRQTACPGRLFPWKTLYAKLDLPPPTHLCYHTPAGTTDRCPWCLAHMALAARESRHRTPPGQAETPDVPPTEMLNKP